MRLHFFIDRSALFSAIAASSNKANQHGSLEALQAQKSVSSIPVRLMSIDITQALKLAIDLKKRKKREKTEKTGQTRI